MTVVQQFMLDYSRELSATFVAKYGDGRNLKSAERMNFQHDLAKAMLSNEYSRLTNELENKAKAHHSVEMDKWNLILDNIALASDVAQFMFCFLLRPR